MSSGTAKQPGSPAQPEDILPPEETFWEKYSPHLEFPLSWAGGIAIFMTMGTLIILIVMRLSDPPKSRSVPVRAVSVFADGDGDGSPGSGGGSPMSESVPKEERFEIPQPSPQSKLEEVREKIVAWSPDMKVDADMLEVMAHSPLVDKLNKLNDRLRKDLFKGEGDKKGQGPAAGNAGGNSDRAGTQGTGASSSQGRTLRWTLSFTTQNGRDYLAQLASLKASVLFPRGNGKAIILRDLNNPTKREEVREIANIKEMFFVDDRVDSVLSMARAVDLDFSPELFIAFFPREVEEELAAKERAYRNRKEEDILSTTFRIVVRGGEYVITVTEQKARR
jgi:hypothetical protein